MNCDHINCLGVALQPIEQGIACDLKLLKNSIQDRSLTRLLITILKARIRHVNKPTKSSLGKADNLHITTRQECDVVLWTMVVKIQRFSIRIVWFDTIQWVIDTNRLAESEIAVNHKWIGESNRSQFAEFNFDSFFAFLLLEKDSNYNFKIFSVGICHFLSVFLLIYYQK